MNAIQEAIATVKEWQVRDPETRFLDGYSMSGDEAWRACLRKVRTMLETIEKGTAEAKLRKLLDGLDSLGIQLVNSGYDDEVVEAISEYIESLRREAKSA